MDGMQILQVAAAIATILGFGLSLILARKQIRDFLSSLLQTNKIALAFILVSLCFCSCWSIVYLIDILDLWCSLFGPVATVLAPIGAARNGLVTHDDLRTGQVVKKWGKEKREEALGEWMDQNE